MWRGQSGAELCGRPPPGFPGPPGRFPGPKMVLGTRKVKKPQLAALEDLRNHVLKQA